MLEAGGALVVPAGVAHTFRVDSDTARVLVLSTPAGLEELVRDGSVPATAATLPPASTPRPSPEELSAVFARQLRDELPTRPSLMRQVVKR
jgi:hypothetical protein